MPISLPYRNSPYFHSITFYYQRFPFHPITNIHQKSPVVPFSNKPLFYILSRHIIGGILNKLPKSTRISYPTLPEPLIILTSFHINPTISHLSKFLKSLINQHFYLPCTIPDFTIIYSTLPIKNLLQKSTQTYTNHMLNENFINQFKFIIKK